MRCYHPMGRRKGSAPEPQITESLSPDRLFPHFSPSVVSLFLLLLLLLLLVDFVLPSTWSKRKEATEEGNTPV